MSQSGRIGVREKSDAKKFDVERSAEFKVNFPASLASVP